MQTKKYSVYESITNIIIGLVLSFLTQLWIYPFCGIEVNLEQNIFITIVFFVISFIRSYAIRRFFVFIEYLQQKNGENYAYKFKGKS